MNSLEVCGECEKTDEEWRKILEILVNAVNTLYHFRDHFFESHPIEEASQKKDYVTAKLDETIKLFDDYKDCEKKYRSKYNYLKGYALNILPAYNKEAEELLSKAVKLDPKLVQAWNELGECYCRKGNIKEAAHCFEKALNYEKNKISLRNISIVLRWKQGKDSTETMNNIELGLKYAKAAVDLDIHDGQSWSIYGNAYLAAFFGISQNPKTLKLGLSAYAQAERDPVMKNSTDLHFNKAVTLKYGEEYLEALNSFDMASRLDPSWDAPKVKGRKLVEYLKEICDLVSTSGKTKPKKLQQMLRTIDSKQLGPYGGGSYTSTSGASVHLAEVTFDQLQHGANEHKVVLGKVVCTVRNEDKLPFTFCLVDKIGTCVVVTVYNLADGKGVIIGHSVAIPEPYVNDIDFTYKNDEYKFRLIRIETPLVLVLNGKKAHREMQAGVQLTLFTTFD